MRHAALLLLAACPPEGAPSDAAAETFVGDPGAPVELRVVVKDPGAGAPLREIRDGDVITLTLPPQGGRVIFVGARARNLDARALRLAGSLRDLQNGAVRLDVRTTNLLVSDGWGASSAQDISTFSNIPICPNQWSTTNTWGTPYELTIEVTDAANRSARAVLRVTLACDEPGQMEQCFCICKQGYTLGEACDASADGAPE